VALLLTGAGVALAKPVFGGALVSRSVGLTIDMAVKAASMGFWSTLTDMSPPLALLLPLLLAATLVCLLTAWLRVPDQRSRLHALGLYIGAFASLVLAVSWGRAGLGWTSSSDAHYGILAVPLFCCVYFVWDAFAPRRVARFVQVGLFALMSIIFWSHASSMVYWRTSMVAVQAAFERDLLSGHSPCVLAERYLSLLWYPSRLDIGRTVVVTGLRQLKQTGITPFRSLQEDPATCPL
jgi:hypothetical protein